MTLPLASLAGALRPFWVGWLDITGDPVRVTTLPGGHTFAATGDTDLDSHAFAFLPAELVAIGAVTHSVGGSDTLSAILSGIPGHDDGLLDAIGSRINWQGRIARLWIGLTDSTGTVVQVVPMYTGFMMTMTVTGDPAAGMTITVGIENYLSVLGAARGRTYQDAAEFDPADVSAARIRAAANGTAGLGALATASGGGGGSGGRFNGPLA